MEYGKLPEAFHVGAPNLYFGWLSMQSEKVPFQQNGGSFVGYGKPPEAANVGAPNLYVGGFININTHAHIQNKKYKIPNPNP